MASHHRPSKQERQPVQRLTTTADLCIDARMATAASPPIGEDGNPIPQENVPSSVTAAGK